MPSPRPCFPVASMLVGFLAVACEQKPVDLSALAEELVWTEIADFPVAPRVRSIWGSGPNDVYVGYSRAEGSLRHFDGQSWEWVSLGVEYVSDIWGSGSDDVYVTTDAGVKRFDGVSWSDAGVFGERVVGTGAADVYVFDAAFVHRFNGADWDTIREPSQPGYYSAAVAFPGDGLIAAWSTYPKPDSLLRWNGSSWSSEVAPGFISSLWGSTSNDVFAAGRNSAYAGAVWRWQGSQWDPMTLPAGVSSVFDVHGVSASEVYATTCCDSLLLTFDGGSWQSQVVAAADGFNSVWASGPTDIYLSYDGSILHGNGTMWTDPFPVMPRGFEAVWAESPQRVVVVSLIGSGVAVYRYDHGNWTEERVPFPGSGVDGIVGSGWNDLYVAVGGSGIIHYDGTLWARVFNGYVFDLSLASDGTLFVATGGGLSRLDGTTWESWDSPGHDYVRSVWAGSSDYAIVVGSDMWRFNGTSFELITDYESYRDVWGVSTREVYFAGDALLKYDGDTIEKFGPPEHFYIITGTGPDHIVAIGSRSAFFKNGADWHSSPHGGLNYMALVPALDGSIVRVVLDGRPVRVRISYHR